MRLCICTLILTSFLTLLTQNAVAADIGQRQKYWDGKSAPEVASDQTCSRGAADVFADNPDYMRPEMMAIGDSLYNGVQSLRINWWLSEWSVPNMIAIRLGLIEEHYGDRTGKRSFYGPQYPDSGKVPKDTRSFGFNLEGFSGYFIRSLADLARLPGVQSKELNYLLNSYIPENNRIFVDNIAFSGASTLDLLHWTAADYRKHAKASLAKLDQSTPTGKFRYLGSAFTFANAAFVLNPTRHPCLENLTAIQQVKLRKPKRLLVNIGANNGIYLVGFAGKSLDEVTCAEADRAVKSADGTPLCVGTIREFLGPQFKQDMTRILSELSGVDGLEFVYINGVALPSQTANVRLKAPWGQGSYFRLSIANGKRVRKEIFDEADKYARSLNKWTKETIDQTNTANSSKSGTHPRIVFVDTEEALRSHDFKRCEYQREHNCERRRLSVDADRFRVRVTQKLDNRSLQASGKSGALTGDNFAARVREGGLFSFDNMHLSSIGYEILALTVRSAMYHAKDPKLGKSLAEIADRCKGRGEEGADRVMPGDCIGLLSTPGWAFADATRRDFTFQRIAGDSQMKSQGYINALFAFVF